MIYQTASGYVVVLDDVKYFCWHIRPTKNLSKLPLLADISRMEQSEEGTKFVRLKAPKDLQLITKIRKVLCDNVTLSTTVL